jgi:alpha-L-arabinofuranosidase
MSRIIIKTEERKIPVAENLYGIFFEDINRAGDGGLYPEMIRNRSFEDSIPPADCYLEDGGYAMVSGSGWRDQFNHGEGLSKWIRQNGTQYTPIPAWYCSNASMELDTSDTLNPNRRAALAVDFGKEGCIRNEGFKGIPQKKGSSFIFYMFAKSDKEKNLTVSVKEGDRVFCSAEIIVGGMGSSGTYSRYDAVLTAEADSSDAYLEICCHEGGRIKFGFMSLMPAETYMGHGLRKDIVEKIAALKPKFMRFPGGCIVEGFSPTTAMRFRNTVGPVWERPSQLLMWHYSTSNGLGFHEYLQLCEDLDMEPLYVFNCGMTCQARKSVLMEGDELSDMIQDTLDALEYALGPADSKWGRLRAEMGHPAPFRMNYMEIGNENFGPDYEERYLKCYDAIHSCYPWIRFVANTHVEQKGMPADIVDEHFYNTAEYFAENINFYDSYDRNGPKIFLGEVSVVRGYVGQLYGALGEAAFLIGAERNQDVVNFISYAPFLENVNYSSWFPNMIRFNNTESFGIPSYYVWKLFSSNRGEYVLNSSEESQVIYRPVKGMGSVLGAPGLRYRNTRWNGKEIQATHELMGHVEAQKDSVPGSGPDTACFVVTAPDQEQIDESKLLSGVDLEKVFIVFGEEEATSGTFETEVFAEAGKEITVGVYSSRLPKQVYVPDETKPPREWNAENVHPFLWRIKDGKSTFIERSYPNDTELSAAVEAELKVGDYNHFRYEADGRRMLLYLNGKLLHEAAVPAFRAVSSVACGTDSEIIIKAVNMSEEEQDIEIILDCEVEDEYEACRVSGEKNAENSFERPYNIYDEKYRLTGAAKEFVYKAPALSANVIRLKKSV